MNKKNSHFTIPLTKIKNSIKTPKNTIKPSKTQISKVNFLEFDYEYVHSGRTNSYARTNSYELP